MTLYDFMKHQDHVSEDTSDTVYDCIVTVEWDWSDSYSLTTNDKYYQFIETIYKCVEFEKINSNGVWIVNWSGFVETYKDIFKRFFNEFFTTYIPNEDDFAYETIGFLQEWLSGAINNKMMDWLIHELQKVGADKKPDPVLRATTSLVKAVGELLNEDPDSQEKVREAVGTLAEELTKAGKTELAEYCLAQTNMCATFVPM